MHDKIDLLQKDLDHTQANYKNLKDTNRSLEHEVSELENQLEKADQARKALKSEFQIANEKIIELEEQLFGEKNIKAEMLE